MDDVDVDVLIAVKNAESFIEVAIDSILTQTFINLRIIVVYQDSIDSTWSILQKLSEKDHRIVLVHCADNADLVSSLNLGLSLANAKYIARMDADDIATPNRIEVQVRFLEFFKEVAIVGSWAKTFGNKEELWMMPERDEDIRVQGLFSSMILNPTAMFRRELLNSHPPVEYRNQFRFGAEDFQFWYELSKKSKLHNIQQGLLFYRLHSQNYSAVKHQQNLTNTRVILADKIRELDSFVSSDELALHYSIAESQCTDPASAKVWFKKLEYANTQKRIYNHSSLLQKLDKEMLRIVARSHPVVSSNRIINYGNLRWIYKHIPPFMRRYIKRLLS